MTCHTEYRIEARWMPREYFGSAYRVLSDKVNKLLAEGWRLYGSPMLSSGDTWIEVSQAMTRTTEED